MANGKPTLQHLNNSQSQQILWLLEELGIEYNLNLFERQTSGVNKNRAPAALKETHALGKSPQLITPEGRVIAERNAISKYLIDRYDTAGKFKLNPNDPENDAIREEELLSLGGNSLSSVSLIKLIFKFLAKSTPFFISPVFSGIGAMLDKGFLSAEDAAMMSYLESCVKDGRQYFLKTENPTRVDFNMIWFMDFRLAAGFTNMSQYPNLKIWYDRCKERDGWKRSLEKGNGYDMNAM